MIYLVAKQFLSPLRWYQRSRNISTCMNFRVNVGLFGYNDEGKIYSLPPPICCITYSSRRLVKLVKFYINY